MRDIKLLTPRIRLVLPQFMAKVTEAGLSIIITSTLRTVEEQKALYAQGRETLVTVNHYRKLAGMWAITAQENRRPVTWTMKSNHLAKEDGFAWAFDFACIGLDGKPHWNEKVSVDDDKIPDYLEVGEIGESFGLTWGGRWETPDYPHLELRP